MRFFYENRVDECVCTKAKDMIFRAHLHRQLELIYVLEGEIGVTVNQTERNMQVGEMAVILPNHIHSYETKQHSLVFMGIFGFSMLGEYTALLYQNQCQHPFLSKDAVHEDIPLLFHRLHQGRDMETRLCRAYTAVLLGRIVESLAFHPHQTSQGQDSMQRVLLYISEHIKEPLTLQRLSDELYLNKNYLSTLFSKRVGGGFPAYVHAIRTDMAAQLLKHTDMPVTDICLECGFDSLRTFYRVFQAQCGMTPHQYRTNFAKENSQPITPP